MMKNILITGAYGFVGSNLSAYLAKQKDIILWALSMVEHQDSHYTSFFSWDRLDDIDWDSVDTVIHLAGKAHDTKNKSNTQVYFDVNTGLTKKVFDYFCKSSARKFIFFSSVKAAADQVVGDILTEDVIPQPKGPYGESKIKAEEYICKKSRNYPEKKVYILRPCMIHGPGNKGNLNLLYRLVSKGLPWPLGSFKNRRSFTSIDNLNFVIGQFIRLEIESGIYHLGDDQAVSTNELVRLIAESVGRRERIWNVNVSLVKFIAEIGDILHLPLNSERLRKLTENYVVSNRKIKNALGVDQLPVSAVDGLRKTLISFKR